MNKQSALRYVLTTCCLLLFLGHAHAQPTPPASSANARWSVERANAWYAKQPWLIGSNYIPANAINQLEMFQAATFDPDAIDRELGWAREKFSMNTMRVYLHDLLWKQDSAGFIQRIDQFLAIAAKHGIRPIFVLFDSCWDPDPVLGPQRRPIPGVHNSGWLQSPGRHDLVDRNNEAHLRAYVEGVVGAFANDERVLAWDLWNEPDNDGGGNYRGKELPQEQERVAELLPKAFAWARSQRPIQPLTSAMWRGQDWSPEGALALNAIQRSQLDQSDIITFQAHRGLVWVQTGVFR